MKTRKKNTKRHLELVVVVRLLRRAAFDTCANYNLMALLQTIINKQKRYAAANIKLIYEVGTIKRMEQKKINII